MNAVFDYYQLAQPDEGVDSGFSYETAPHITSTTIANDEPPKERRSMTSPLLEAGRPRLRPVHCRGSARACRESRSMTSGRGRSPPMTASPAPARRSVRATGATSCSRPVSGARAGNDRILASRAAAGTRWLHADAETKEATPQRVVVSFGPEHAPLEQRQVELALDEAETLRPKPKIVVFAAFQFDPEAAKDIDETNWPGVTLLKAQMNADLLTEDLKKKRASNESFWLIGQPDVELGKIAKGDAQGQVPGRGPRLRLLQHEDRRHRVGRRRQDRHVDAGHRLRRPQPVPAAGLLSMAGMKDGWATLAKNLKAEIDEDLIEAYRGTVSLPFEAGKHKRAAVKIVDDRGSRASR